MHRRPLAALAALVLVSGCRKDGAAPEGAAPPPGETVATVGSTAITIQDVERRLAQQPDYVRVRYSTPEKRAEFLDSLVRTELLVQEARKQHLEEEADVKEVVERLLVQKLLQKQLDAAPVTEADARAAYEANRADYLKPERVRLAHVLFAVPPGDVRRPVVRAEAQKELSALQAAKPPARQGLFSALVRKRSNDEATRAAEGDLGPRTREELGALLGPTGAEAAFALQSPGDVAPVVESDKGFHLLWLVGRQPGETTSFEVARPRIEGRLRAEGRAKTLEALVTRLRAAGRVEVHADALAKVKVAAPAGPLVPAAAGQGPSATGK